MQHKIKIQTLFVMVVITGSVAALAMRGQPQNTPPPVPKEQSKKVRDLPIVDFDAPATNALRRKAKGARYDRQSSEPIHEAPSISGRVWSNHWARGLEALPIDSSDTILIGTIIDAQAYLSNDKTGVYSEFGVLVVEVLKQDAAKPPIENTVSVERFGGAVRFASGALQKYETTGQGMPHRGGRYLFFLKRLDAEPSFSIVTAYELGDQTVSPLDGAHFGEGNERYPFDIYKGFDTTTFLQIVRTAIANKAKSALQVERQ
jgi:hypothetical protein